jgi:hypothetical protein
MNQQYCTKVFIGKIKRPGGKEQRIIAIGDFLGILWNGCGMFWKQSLKNEVQHTAAT